MLVLARSKGQSIRIGNEIEIIINDVSAKVVKLAINAPGHVVLRGELEQKTPLATKLLQSHFDKKR